jgi:hypothetical protein
MPSSTSTFPSHQDLIKRHENWLSKPPFHSPFLLVLQHYDRPRGSMLAGSVSTKVSRSFFALIMTILTLTWTLWNYPVLLRTDEPQTEGKTEAAAVAGAVLEVFQVYPPVQHLVKHQENKDFQGPNDNKDTTSTQCSSAGYEIVLMNHSFGFSYGKPFVGTSPTRSPKTTF